MIPYERIIQWVAGPFSVFIGGVAVKATTNWHWLGSFGISKQSAASGIAKAVIFVASAGVTYAAHQKWLDNLAKWWDHQAAPPAVSSSQILTTSSTGTVTPLPPNTAPTQADDLEAGPADEEILEPEGDNREAWLEARAAQEETAA